MTGNRIHDHEARVQRPNHWTTEPPVDKAVDEVDIIAVNTVIKMPVKTICSIFNFEVY